MRNNPGEIPATSATSMQPARNTQPHSAILEVDVNNTNVVNSFPRFLSSVPLTGQPSAHTSVSWAPTASRGSSHPNPGAPTFILPSTTVNSFPPPSGTFIPPTTSAFSSSSAYRSAPTSSTSEPGLQLLQALMHKPSEGMS